MRGRLLLGAFVLGLVAVGVAAAAFNDTWSDHLSGGQEVPANASQGQGQATFRLSDDGTSLDYKLIASNVDNVIVSHIHLGAEGVNGPVVVFLYGPVAAAAGRQTGVLATGTITAANLVGPLAGHPLSDLVAAMRTGGAYVNLHTNDGVAPAGTGPGDLPGGELRAQIIE
jgi:CHRD domain-containing protein